MLRIQKRYWQDNRLKKLTFAFLTVITDIFNYLIHSHKMSPFYSNDIFFLLSHEFFNIVLYILMSIKM